MVVESRNMSIINQMHQDFEKSQHSQPVLGGTPNKKNKKKIVIVFFVFLLIVSSCALSYLIFTQQKSVPSESLVIDVVENTDNTEAVLQANNLSAPTKPIVEVAAVTKAISNTVKTTAAEQEQPAAVQEENVIKTVKAQPQVQKVIADTKKDASNLAQQPEQKSVDKNTVTIQAQQVTALDDGQSSYLEIKPAQLSASELAQIYLKEADKAEASGDLNLAANKREQALSVQPDLNEVRKSLALYYYSAGDVLKSQRLLQQGALTSPEYSDFNLMLSRMALKEGNEQKAYRYLEHNPPKVAGHLDYYVSYAVLALKLNKYVQAEKLYQDLLSQQVNNGRWRMSLAIAQDKQMKKELAITNYNVALLQHDLSSKAKDYINQRLRYLDQNKGMQ